MIIKRNDTRTSIKAFLQDANGNPVDLTSASVTFNMKSIGGERSLSKVAHIENPVNGEVWVVWVVGDTDTAGSYRAEFKVIFQDGKKETYPNSDYINIRIIEDL